MKMKTLRKLRTIAPRRIRSSDFGDPTMEADPGPAPERIFDRSTGPFDHRRAVSIPGVADEET